MTHSFGARTTEIPHQFSMNFTKNIFSVLKRSNGHHDVVLRRLAFAMTPCTVLAQEEIETFFTHIGGLGFPFAVETEFAIAVRPNNNPAGNS
jgi:hypothetical protein